MWYVEKLTNSNPGPHLSIELGNNLLIKVPDMDACIKSSLIGLEPQQYLIVNIPLGSDLENQLKNHKKLNVTYMSLGTTYGFDSDVLGVTKKPAKLLFLSYPDAVIEKDQRETQRVSCHIPATAIIKETRLNGIITDMSPNGCRFVVRIPAKITPYQVRILTDVHLSFALHGIDGSEELSGVVRNTSIDRFRISLGIEFENISDETQNKLSDYLEKLLDY
jgi:c-di-GMP-binding flagellar brake protein YcgR